MGGENKQFRWTALFRDGHVIEQPLGNRKETLAALKQLTDYMYGTPENPRKHYLVWFKMENGEQEFIVSFDSDGDAYINTSDGKMIMTEFKIRSAHLVFIPEDMMAVLGFCGVNTCDAYDGKWLLIKDDGTYELASENELQHGMIRA